MPRNVSELKSGGGTIPMLSPRPENWGGGRVHPVPHRSTPVPVVGVSTVYVCPRIVTQTQCCLTVSHQLHVTGSVGAGPVAMTTNTFVPRTSSKV